MAIRDVGGLEVLINLLETAEVKCKVLYSYNRYIFYLSVCLSLCGSLSVCLSVSVSESVCLSVLSACLSVRCQSDCTISLAQFIYIYI